MPSTFANRPSDERSSLNIWNGEHDHDGRDDGDVAAPVSTTGASVEELREELAVARRRLQYYEGFAPWIEEQMAAVVGKAAEVAGESEREQARLAEEIERRVRRSSASLRNAIGSAKKRKRSWRKRTARPKGS